MYEKRVLENGLRVLTAPMPHMRSISVAFFVGLGSRYESDSESGAAHFIEHMLFKGTRSYPSARRLAEAVEGIGGMFNAGTGQESTLYWAKVAQPHLPVAMDVLLEMLLHPTFETAELEKERSVILEEISLSLDMPDQWVHLLLMELIWPDQPLGRSVAGSHDSVGGLQKEMLLSTMSRWYSPTNIVLVIAGNLDGSSPIDLLDEAMCGWLPSEAPVYQPATDSQVAPQIRLGHRDTEQAHLCLSAPGLPRHHPDRFALSLMNAILGEGMSSRLFQEIRERLGLAYDVGSSVSMLDDTGAVVAYAGVDPERAPLALQAILTEWDKIRQAPVPVEELRKAKEFLKGRLYLQMEDTFNVTAWAGRQELHRGSILSVEEVVEAIEAVESDDVQILAQRLFRTEKLNCALVGPFTDSDIFREMVHL
jgi:predicted Zn-dependent peptidase